MDIQAFLFITTSHSNHVSVSLQNLLFPLFSLKFCPKTLAEELNLPVQFTILQKDICGRVRTNKVKSWRTHRDQTPVEEGIVKVKGLKRLATDANWIVMNASPKPAAAAWHLCQLQVSSL
ncbi:hypothetical protein Ahy_A02g007470 isoform B [Arachis hypogaea]|uniref:Uncharacterized protein n=1 Tax=Arachis hypogaea TaxID=3818 RepID=A0A445ECU5_ARAHY|nr:hypothetical protein Ahy_A02g007470 isoform B [Arachis hypogaea]